MTGASRLGKALLLGTTAGGLSFATYKALQANQFDPRHIGAARFGRAAYTVGRIGLDYRQTLYSSSTDETAPDYEELKSACHKRSAERLLELCRANGGCFVKVGQHIGALDYLLPEEYVSTMRVLHNNAPEMPLDELYEVFQEDMKEDPRELFSEFDEKPLGTASLAQVHRARLKDGREVAVKVQHKKVKDHSFVDIYTMEFLVKAVKYVFPEFEFMWLAEEMKKNLPLELSFTHEAKNAEKVAQMYRHYDWLKIPEIHWALTTDRVLTMEYCPGKHINDIEYLKEQNFNLPDIASKISLLYSDMIFKEGYVHCDPHPGNVLVNKDDNGNMNIVLLDHGLYTQLTSDFRHNYANFWLCILKADLDGIKQYADILGVGQLYGLFACMVAGRSWRSIEKGLDRAEKNADESKEIKENAQKYMKEITDVLAFVNRQMILIFKTNDLLRTIEFNLGTSKRMTSFIQMSRACFHCLYEERLRLCRSAWCRFRINCASSFEQFKISCYQVFLWLWWSPLGSFGRRMIGQ